MAVHYPNRVPKSLESILIPSFCAAIPYLIRARQCIVMYIVGQLKHDSKRYQHALNALKYCSSIFPICLSAYQQTLSPEKAATLEGTLLVLLIINATYALAWDIIMDWGMFQDPTIVAQYACIAPTDTPVKVQSCGHAMMRPKLRFGITASATIAIADTILRFSWLLRFRMFLFPSKDHFVLATQLLEAFRRAIWNLLRIEWESIKQNKARQEEEDEDDEVAPFFKAPPGLQMTHIGNSSAS
ncbi:EXS family [Fragilaria crotonensis]|nr:EXS family [Fragilaria crotonensis]